MTGKIVYLIDGSSYIYRAYHAIAPLSNSKGQATHAVLGFVNMINRLLRNEKPRYLAIAFDSRGPVFRHQLYPDYKANRPPMPDDLVSQIPYIHRFVEAAGLPTFQRSGFEADDLIASSARRLEEGGNQVVIVSGDKDLLQLVSERVTIWDPMRDRRMDPAAVEQKYGVPPNHLLDYFALVGDSSDNIPGVPGVGPKTAQKLIGKQATLENLYASLDGMKPSKMKEKLAENRDQAFLSRDLIRLKEDLDIPSSPDDYLYPGPENDLLKDLYQELEFTSLLKNLEGARRFTMDVVEIVRTRSELRNLVALLEDAEICCIDTETTSLDARTASLVGISLCCSAERAYYIPVDHREKDGKVVADQVELATVRDLLVPALKRADLLLAGHNLKYDLTVLRQNLGVRLYQNLADTLIAAHLLSRGEGSLKLEDLCRTLGYELTSFEDVVGGDRRADSFSRVPIDKAALYSCEDVLGTWMLWQKYQPELEEAGLMKLFAELEMKVLPILVDMELVGIKVDGDVLETLRSDFLQILEALEQQIYSSAGHEFNIQSPKQLGQVLFDELGLPHGRKTKTGYSTDVKVLEKLALKHELPALVLRYRTVAKLLSTYVEKLAVLRVPETGRIHTSFNQAVTATGRLSSSEPNLQNIPIRSEDGERIRSAFVPADGQMFLSADYSQIDLRVLAHFSGDRALVDAFRNGEDIHARTAAEVFGVSSMMVTGEMRRVAKSINFGIVYGMSAFGLATQLNIGRKEAQRFIDRYFDLYRGVKQFMADIVEQARSDGYITTLFGRRRYLPEIHSRNKARREFAERMAINTPIQGTAAEIIKQAMIDCTAAIEENRLEARLLLQIHDELVFELPADEVQPATTVIRNQMEKAVSLEVPLVANVEVGTSLMK